MVTAPVPTRIWTIRWASEGWRSTGGSSARRRSRELPLLATSISLRPSAEHERVRHRHSKRHAGVERADLDVDTQPGEQSQQLVRDGDVELAGRGNAGRAGERDVGDVERPGEVEGRAREREVVHLALVQAPDQERPRGAEAAADRKSTRLNSSHLGISY